MRHDILTHNRVVDGLNPSGPIDTTEVAENLYRIFCGLHSEVVRIPSGAFGTFPCVRGTVTRRRVTVPASENVEVRVSSKRLREELADRGIEPPAEIGYERSVLTDEDLSLEERAGLPFLDGRVAVSEEATTPEEEPAIRTATVEIDPQRLNMRSEGQFVTVYLGFDDSVDLSGFDPAAVAVAGVRAVADDKYGFVQNPPVEHRDGKVYVMVRLPRGEFIDTLDMGENTPQALGRVDDALFRGRGSVTLFNPESDSSGDSGNSSNSGTSGKGNDNQARNQAVNARRTCSHLVVSVDP